MRSNSPSDTSLLVARCILLASKDPHLCRLLATGESEILMKILGNAAPAGWMDFVLENRWARGALLQLERAMVPGIIAHYLARKRWIERRVREAFLRGVRQVVLLGAGMDTLAARLHTEFPPVLFLELDHPATQTVKRSALDSAPNFLFQPVDLATESLASAVAGCPRFSKNLPAIIIAEGLTMYLTAERVAALLQDGAGDVVVCSTGLIGPLFSGERLLAGVDLAAAALSAGGGPAAAEAIMTTDSVAKTTVVKGDGWSIGGMAKGAGMLAPGMATMLCVITTDAIVDPHATPRIMVESIKSVRIRAPDIITRSRRSFSVTASLVGMT